MFLVCSQWCVCQKYFKVGVLFYIIFECLNISLEGGYALFRGLTGGTGLAALERFLHHYIAGFCQLVNLDTEVACCGTGLRFEIDKIRFIDINEYGHDSQA